MDCETHVIISFTHRRLLRHRAGPSVKPGSLSIEGDLDESWQQTSDTPLRLQAAQGRALPRQAAGQRPRASGRRRTLHLAHARAQPALLRHRPARGSRPAGTRA